MVNNVMSVAKQHKNDIEQKRQRHFVGNNVRTLGGNDISRPTTEYRLTEGLANQKIMVSRGNAISGG
jgi:hypothetical protein